jgi:hypothetical protein
MGEGQQTVEDSRKSMGGNTARDSNGVSQIHAMKTLNFFPIYQVITYATNISVSCLYANFFT